MCAIPRWYMRAHACMRSSSRSLQMRTGLRCGDIGNGVGIGCDSWSLRTQEAATDGSEGKGLRAILAYYLLHLEYESGVSCHPAQALASRLQKMRSAGFTSVSSRYVEQRTVDAATPGSPHEARRETSALLPRSPYIALSIHSLPLR